MRKLYLVPLAIVLVAALIFGGCAASSKKTVNFITTSTGTPAHGISTAWATLIGKYLPEIEATVTPTTNKAVANKTFLQGRGDITETGSVILGTQLPEFFGGKTLAEGPRALITNEGAAIHLMTLAKSDINSVEDFRGKKIIGKVVGAASTDVMRTAILTAYGMTDDDIVLLSGNSGRHNIEQLREGVGDAAIIIHDIRSGPLVELTTLKDIRFLPFPKDKAEAFVAEVGWVLGTMPAGSYRGQDKDVPTVRLPGAQSVQRDMDEEVAYNILKVLYEHFDEFVGMTPGGEDFRIEGTLKTWFQPFHPGAIKYYKEKGMWTKEMDGEQQKVLNQVVPVK